MMFHENSKPMWEWGFPHGHEAGIPNGNQHQKTNAYSGHPRQLNGGEWKDRHQSPGSGSILLVPGQDLNWFQRLKRRFGKILHKPGMLWGRAISKHSVSHTQMHNSLTQTIKAGIVRQWQHSAWVNAQLQQDSRASCWRWATTLTLFLWRHSAPLSHHSIPELLRVGGTAGVMQSKRK